MPEPNEGRPLTEAEWERFMQHNDARSAKFGELLETLMDHPDRDAIIAREMGWDAREPNPEVVEMMNAAAEAVIAADEAKSWDTSDKDSDPFDDEDGFRSLPAYQKAFE